jgi:Zn-dependent peptidase ImmA (M78 family)
MTVKFKELAEQAMLTAIDVREVWQRDDDGPLDVYALCQDMGVAVRFVSIPSMEGLYGRRDDGKSVILLPSQRPLPRRVFSCGHELGHHVFGHGSSIDQMIGTYTDRKGGSFDPNEFLVDTFAGFLLMPTLGIRNAFTSRDWKVADATPEQIFAVACSFGVGYETLITHMTFSLQMLNRSRAKTLSNDGPKSIRERIFGRPSAEPLIIVDHHWAMPTVDAEVGTLLLLPDDAEADGAGLVVDETTASGRLFRASRPGITRVSVPGTSWALFIRIAKKEFVGLAQYRHLECEEDEGNE